MDTFFSFVTEYKNFLAFLVPWLIYLLVKGGSKGRWFVLTLALGILAADQTSSHLVKPLVERVRPCNALEDVLTPAGASASYSFPSSHAANMGAALLLLAVTYGRWAWFFVPVALASGVSRIYLGLHYPSDVMGGYLLGALCGWLVWRGMEKVRMKINFKGSKVRARKKR